MPEYKTIDRYMVATASDPDEMKQRVNDLIKLGWQPYRSGYGMPTGDARYCQPMVQGSW